MSNQKGFTNVLSLLVGLILIMGLASAVSTSVENNNLHSNPYTQNTYTKEQYQNTYTNQQYQNPIIRVDTNPSYQNTTYYPTQIQNPTYRVINTRSPQQACAEMNGYWYSNTNTCTGNIDPNKCSLAGGKINMCDSSCRYARAEVCPAMCETTCVF